MQVTHQDHLGNTYLLGLTKSFLLWSFTLTVCFLVVGFPVVVVIITIGALAALILQSILPASAVLLVAGSILSTTVSAILLSAIALTLKGIHPQQVSWLRWLHGQATPEHNATYASCPLTCSITNV